MIITDFKSNIKKYLLKNILVVLILCFTLPTFAIIDINIKNAPESIFYLQQIKGDRLVTLDSALILNEHLQFSWKSNYLPGMYRVYSGDNSLLFLASEKEVVLQTTWPKLQENLLINQSKENELWFAYLEIKEQSYRHLDLLNPIINWYDKDSDFYDSALKEFQNQQNSLPLWIKEQAKNHPNYLAIQLMQSDIKPELPMGLSLEAQKAFLIKHWFDHVDWYNTNLKNTDIITNKITEYLGLFADRTKSKAELEMAFKYAVDQVIPLVEDNNDMYAFVLDYLIRGFERYGFEEVILHIALNYTPPSEQCENEERKSEALARLEKYEAMQIGQTAMDFVLPNLQGEDIKLSATKKDKILIVFWASWCPHCKELIKELNVWYTPEKQALWQVYALSIDEDKQELKDFVSAQNIQLPILCNYMGWDTQAVIDYNIYATPTMIVLNKELEIIDKPVRISELK